MAALPSRFCLFESSGESFPFGLHAGRICGERRLFREIRRHNVERQTAPHPPHPHRACRRHPDRRPSPQAVAGRGQGRYAGIRYLHLAAARHGHAVFRNGGHHTVQDARHGRARRDRDLSVVMVDAAAEAVIGGHAPAARREHGRRFCGCRRGWRWG
ncbi:MULTISPECIES: hypothetical protein [unclassified Neomoorella]|uniref:hypothetical protein n=1 Tax=unclassified Neomoorella TaxID=2676739 RepID=UPI00155B2E14|nr:MULTISPECIES: hypothetical protein [unclassified Moorella (in: firmicutes)]